MSASQAPRPAQPAPRTSRGQVVLSVVGAAVGLLFAVLLYRAVGPDSSVSTQLRGFVVQSDDAVEVEFEVAREPGTEVLCVLRARGTNGLEVGRAEVDVPVSSQRSTVERHVVTTTARATTGELVGCREGRADDDGGASPAP